MTITNDKLYQAINDSRKEIISYFKDEIEPVKSDIREINSWRNRVIGQFSIIMVFVGAGVNWLFNQFMPRK